VVAERSILRRDEPPFAESRERPTESRRRVDGADVGSSGDNTLGINAKFLWVVWITMVAAETKDKQNKANKGRGEYVKFEYFATPGRTV
jgi:hypothetical protein